MSYIEQISIQNFRNIREEKILFNKNLNILYGDNAQGKTNLLECVYLSAIGRSNRNKNDKEFINWDSDDCHIKTVINNENYKDTIDLHIRKDSKKGFAINGLVIKKMGELFGLLPVILFSPDDLKLINYGPSERRRFIDMELCQSNKIYYNNLVNYYKILKQRNNTLKKIKYDKKWKDTLFTWDEQLIMYGSNIIKARSEFVNNLSDLAYKKHLKISKNKESLSLHYKNNVEILEYADKLNKIVDKDILLGNTLIGPHKDDLIFNINGHDARSYASQGQKRTIILSIKLAEINFIENELNKSPILLLDDVLSELDNNRQDFILESTEKVQTFITSTGIDKILTLSNKNVSYFEVKEGKFFSNIL